MTTGYIDFDTHLYEPISVWKDYIDPKFRDRAPEWIEKDGKLMLNLDEKLFPTAPGHGGYAKIYAEDAKVDRSGNDPVSRLGYMDGKGGADVQVIYPTLGLAGFPNSVRDADLAAAFARAYNRYISEFTATDRRRLKGTMLLPANHPEAAAEEMRWAHKHAGLNLAVLTPTPPNDVPWSALEYDPMWQAADELGITVLFHETTAGCPSNAIGIHRYRANWPMLYLCTHVLEAQLAFADMILGGTLAKYPNLRVGAAEAHVHWLPGWLALMDQNFGMGTNIYKDQSLSERELKMKPSEYFRRQCVLAAFPEDTMIAEAMAAAPESIVICSDWPHPIAEEAAANGIQAIETRDELTAAQKQALLVGNAQRFL
ncbi:amidohydrolase family protein [Novosphingobium album (ex Liu et al. 2023)]|uniref:Amidohydrolase family protein n=1 Tax=Novosphingobium album (ex Liu et al. 2023) TaxID=3031130 RepID=A0ABT5WXB2_9SPHN|nr:amidohydrolase family protein [Novosphingobium album (ex Liu et al. 2023)]MDE8654514.1 amidohydrolase family protein [Novosphingobium album (ex Liu et al. 2023)]